MIQFPIIFNSIYVLIPLNITSIFFPNFPLILAIHKLMIILNLVYSTVRMFGSVLILMFSSIGHFIHLIASLIPISSIYALNRKNVHFYFINFNCSIILESTFPCSQAFDLFFLNFIFAN